MEICWGTWGGELAEGGKETEQDIELGGRVVDVVVLRQIPTSDDRGAEDE